MKVTFLNDRVFKEFKKIPADMQADFFHILEIMEKAGNHNLGLPHIRKLEGEIWEIRMKGRAGIARALYAVENDDAKVLHVFVKKDQKTPRQSIDLAKERWRKR
jgi:phage-related protein